MKQKILLFFSLCLITASSSWAQTATAPTGSGIESDPYQIANLENLYWITQADTAWDAYYEQTADIDASQTSTWDSEAGFFPIGNDTAKFTGTYNGAGYTIDSLSINRSSTDYVGLFGRTSDATITDLGITNCSIIGYEYVGGLAGSMGSSYTSSCYVTGDIEGENLWIGGLVGMHYQSEMDSCHALVNISGDAFVGALIGMNSESAVSSCYASGSALGASTVGGLVGKNSDGSIENCYSTAKVTGNDCTGGLVGTNYDGSSIAYCYFTGNVSASGYSGVFVGYNNGSTLSNCFYNGETSVLSDDIGWDNNDQSASALTLDDFKAKDSFTDWDFTDSWSIDEGISFPLLNGVDNVPVILYTLSGQATINTEYSDMVEVINMDCQSVSFSLTDSPNDMTINTNGEITWTPTSAGLYTFDITVTGSNGLANTYRHAIEVFDLVGSGTDVDPYQIATLSDLQQLSVITLLWNGSYYFIQTANIDASETSTWNDGEGFSPIGNSIINFNGSYDGQGYVISGLTINRATTENVGLFGYTYGANIANIGLSNCSITGDWYVGGIVGNNRSSSNVSNCYALGAVTGDREVGGVIGYNYSSTMSNCYAACTISADYDAGGLVGWNNNSSISNCYALGNVSASGDVGGLVGENASTATITSCYFNIETSNQTEGVGEDDNDQSVIGITTIQMKQDSNFDGWDFSDTWEIEDGTTFPRLQNLYDVPIILPTLCTTAFVDQVYTDTIQVVLMDNQNVSISLTTSPDDMTLTEDSLISWTPTTWGSYIAKITATDDNGYSSNYSYAIKASEMSGSGTESDPYTVATLEALKEISNSSQLWQGYYFEQTADIDASETENWNDGEGFLSIANEDTSFTGNYNGQGYVISGLTINRPSGSSDALFAYTEDASITNLGLKDCSITGGLCSGGLIGQSSESTIKNCYVSGAVSANKGSNDESSCGGLIGESEESTVSGCYSTGSISGDYFVGGLIGFCMDSEILNSYSTGKTSSELVAGGLIGYNISSEVNYCYSTGSVLSSDIYAGGLVGANANGALTACYYNTETSGQSTGIAFDYSAQTVTGLSTTQMTDSSYFDAWSFTTDTAVWVIRADSIYPALLGVSNNAPFAFADTLEVGVSIDLSTSLLVNDYDYETAQDSLTYKIESYPEIGSISDSNYAFNSSDTIGTQDTLIYCVGELLSESDTLWGNYATVILKKVNSAPELTEVSDTSINESTSVTISLSDVSVSDFENDALSLLIADGDNYTSDDYTITPTIGYYGTLSVGIAVTDGDLNSDTIAMTITVSAVPDTTTITWESPDTMVYGAAIGSDAMNATASNTEGVISYSFASDSIFDAGIYELQADFIPTNSNEYTSAVATVEYVVTQAELTATAEDQIITQGAEMPEFTIGYSGFVNGDTESDLDELPTASSTATSTSDAGEYTINVAGGSDANYSFIYESGTLTISIATDIKNSFTESISVYPNPATTSITVTGSTGIASLYNLTGAMVLSHDLSQSTSINVSQLPNGVYLLHVNGTIIKLVKK
jgi:hypothetical protein